MALPPKKDHRISLAEAAGLTKAHRTAHAGAPKAHMFHREAFDTILAQPGCAGIRIYHGRDAKGEQHCVMVGVDQKGADMTSGGVMQQSYPCPPYCDEQSALSR
ncbi:MAG TPA: hypothetical protein VG712_05785 [Gemmatimonadales bacterium]|nr:hypothetical protein [Gemmatimonadales bacterium]